MTIDDYWQAFLRALSQKDSLGVHQNRQTMAKIIRCQDEDIKDMRAK
jgi:hypothetical protein